MKTGLWMALSMKRAGFGWMTLAVLLLFPSAARAQFDPVPRQVLHLGAEMSLHDDLPLGAYLFYYWNMVHTPATNQFLRFAIAPVYVDSELAFKGLLGENTDLAIGAFGGLYANNYREVDGGDYIRHESFDGESAGANVSIYHLFNPGARIPLTGILRGVANYEWFDNTSDTDNSFELPHNQPFYTFRSGLRWGGVEPMLNPVLAMELSGWYELVHRPNAGGYGFLNDRELESVSHRFFGRFEFRMTTPDWQHYIAAGLQGGTLIHPDRLSAFRLGGTLDYSKEFPLNIPGYGFEELSAESYGLVYGAYTIPFGSAKQWNIVAKGAAALVDYVEGTGQGGAFNSGVGIGFGYTHPNRRWKITTLASYGFQAQRSDGSGGYMVGLMTHYNFGATKVDSDYAFEEMQRSKGVTPE